MKYHVLRLLPLFCIFFTCLTACEKEDGTPEEEDGASEKAERTVLVYFAADNSLTSYARTDLEELKEGIVAHGLSANRHLLVYKDLGGEATLIELLNQNGTVVENTLKNYPDRNSAGKEEMQEVFDDVFSNQTYQAESYALVYWSHADGWIPYPLPSTRWIGQDTGDGDNRMSLSDFKAVLETAPHFDFILFDACFMQSMEVIYELRNYADYYIASPTETPGTGAPYDDIFPYMFMEGAAAELAEAYFDIYDGMYQQSGTEWRYGVSLCAMKTDALESLAVATQEALQAVVPADVNLTGLRNDVFDYDKRSYSSHVGYYDLPGMMESLLDASAYQTWKSVFDSFIIFWNTTDTNYSSTIGSFSMQNANGVSNYIPSSADADACASYHSLDWYNEAGISQMGW